MLSGRLRECDRLLPRPGSVPAERAEPTVSWPEFCDPDGPWLSRCAEEWQERGEFRHHRAGLVLVAFRFGWLAACATVPEHHFGAALPSLEGLRVSVDDGGRLAGLRLTGEAVEAPISERRWWEEVSAAFAPLTEALHALGGPKPGSHEYWGNPVGLVGTVLGRLERAGMPGNVMESARRLSAATGRPELLRIDPELSGTWARRRTCCQWWRRTGGGYCAECVLHDSPRTR
ncbi:hypothetical protein [Halosaccharopolyspora lacisalsi]|uniref:hypothetical protein n=1 Tax=Halosaccharopolyspora lacisalsi TaxID=1000566 RepID=UPI002E2B8E17|nr:hypothetical protein [Halosaccharopolyspora lacisalsi]